MPKTKNGDDEKSQTTKGNKTSRRKDESDEPIEQIHDIVDMTNRISKKNADLEKENNTLRIKNDDFERKNQMLTQKLADSEGRSASQTTRLRDTENKNASLSKRNNELEDENEKLREDHGELEKSVEDMSKKLKLTQNQTKNTQAENIRLQDEISEVNGNKKTGQKPKRREEDEKEIKDLEDQIAVLKKEQEQIQRAAAQARRELQLQKW